MAAIIPHKHAPTDNIYVDAGAGQGSTVLSYCRKHNPTHIYAFEPNTDLFRHKNWKTVVSVCKNVTRYRRAVWVEESIMRLYIDPKPKSKGSTIYRSKRNLPSKPAFRNIKCIDFASFLSHITGLVTVKMNIEGAEYKVLQHITLSGGLHKINRMIISFHAHKIPGMEAIHKDIFQNLYKQFHVTRVPGYKNRYDMRNKGDTA